MSYLYQNVSYYFYFALKLIVSPKNLGYFQPAFSEFFIRGEDWISHPLVGISESVVLLSSILLFSLLVSPKGPGSLDQAFLVPDDNVAIFVLANCRLNAPDLVELLLFELGAASVVGFAFG